MYCCLLGCDKDIFASGLLPVSALKILFSVVKIHLSKLPYYLPHYEVFYIDKLTT